MKRRSPMATKKSSSHLHHLQQQEIGSGSSISPLRLARFRFGQSQKDNPNNATASSDTGPYSFASSSSSISATANPEDEQFFLQAQQQDQRSPQPEANDALNYALLIVLYTLQGIPMGLSASIPFLIQQKLKLLTASSTATSSAALSLAAESAAALSSSSSSSDAITAARLSYQANAIFALCSWPFSLKLLWAPIVDACFFRRFGRRKSWLIPVQTLAGALMVGGANFVERQLGIMNGSSSINAVHDQPQQVLAAASLNVKGVTAFFFCLYFLMATQDIAVDGWALTMLSKKNRGRGPVCNSIGQNIGYFVSFVGFLALNDAESSELIWRPLLGLPSNPAVGLVSLGSFIRFMGYFMLVTTTAVALFKSERMQPTKENNNGNTGIQSFLSFFKKANNFSKSKQQQQSATLGLTGNDVYLPSERLNKIHEENNDSSKNNNDEHDAELDAYQLGLKETYHRLWAVCKLPAVRWLFLILLTYRFPTALSDNVKFLKAVEFGLSKSTTALLNPTVILPLAILVPIVATKIWHGHPLRQFMTAYRFRVTLTPLLDVIMLYVLKHGKPKSAVGMLFFWSILILSTAGQAIVSSLQFNAQMTFFAQRVDPAIGGSYMTLLNTAANLGGTWPSSFVMWMVGQLTQDPECHHEVVIDAETGQRHNGPVCSGGRDPYFVLQVVFSLLGILWIAILGKRVKHVADLPDDAWKTHLLDEESAIPDNRTSDEEASSLLRSVDVELGGLDEEEINRNLRFEPKEEGKFR